MAEIEGLVRALREGDDAAKASAARALGDLMCLYISTTATNNRVRIVEAGGIRPLVELLRDGLRETKVLNEWAFQGFWGTSRARF